MINKLVIYVGILILFVVPVMAFVPYPLGDYDSDNVLNQADNCYYVWNPDQLNSDGDIHGDVCDPSPFGICGDNMCLGDEASYCSLDCGEIPGDGDDNDNGGDDGTGNGDGTGDGDDGTSDGSDDNDKGGKGTSSGYSGLRNLGFYCETNWECNGWSLCSDEIQKRTCYDTNGCSGAYNKPLENLVCYPNSDISSGNNFINNYSLTLFLGMFIIVILSLMLLFRR